MAGVVPVIRVLSESLAGAHVERVHGIVNGTTNFIFSEMTRGSSYEEALAEAQRQGYAEADPSDDVSGRDAAAKMAILARLAFGTPVHIDQVPYEGIEQLQTDDLGYARELGLGLKLIGTAERRDGGLSVRVHPAFLYAGHPLASVNGPFNAVTVESEAITEITMSGPGAGGRRPPAPCWVTLSARCSHPRRSRPRWTPCRSCTTCQAASTSTWRWQTARERSPDRPRAGRSGSLDQVSRPAWARRARAPDDGHPPVGRVAPARGPQTHRGARLPTLDPSRDTCNRRGVHVMSL